MTLKFLLGSAAIVALALAASAPVAAADATTTTSTSATTGATAGSTTGSTSTSIGTNSNTTPTGAGATTSTTGTADTKSGTAQSKASTSAGVSLKSVENPEQTLANATVQDKSGAAIGQVKKVSLDSKGKANEIFVQIEGKVVMVNATKLKFHKDTNILMSTMTKEEIDKLPQAQGI